MARDLVGRAGSATVGARRDRAVTISCRRSTPP